MASEAMKDVQTLQKLEQELDLELKQALEIKQALELALFKELDMMSEIGSEMTGEMTGEAKAAVQKQGKSAESNTSRLPARTEAQSHVGGKHERECDDEETNGNTKRQKK